MRIATFNANSIRARLDLVANWLKVHQPDALCIQETKVIDEDFPVEPFNDIGYHVSFRGQKSYNGVAIMSLKKPDKVIYGFGDKNPDDTRLQYAKFGPVHLINTYVPQGRELDHEMYPYKIQWFKRLRKFFDQHLSTRMKVLWVGDMNVAPEHMDIHNADQQANHVCYHVDVRESFAQAIDWGFEDIFRKHQPHPGQYSYFDYRTINAVQRKMGWRIDHILATPSLARKSTDAFIDMEPRLMERPSDHTFMVADFDL